MTIDGSRLSSTSMLARRLLWNRALSERSRPQPVVVLLGPTGAGKTTALKSISEDCGGDVVHALFDFKRAEPVTTVEALAQIAFDLSRRWTARRAARFTRFTLGLIAVQTQLDTFSRAQAKEELRAAIEEFARSQPSHRLARRVGELADAAERTDVLTPVLAETVKVVLPLLIRTIGRRSLAGAKHWHADIPEAEGASPLDALVALNQRARAQPADMTAWLIAAFLADVRENHPRMAAPDPGSPCSCDNPGRMRHLHNWILLLDNIDHEGGARLVTDLAAARERHLRQYPDGHDALAVIATSGRWNPEWDSWHPPWRSSSGKSDRVRIVPHCRDASYQHWADNPDAEHPRSGHYPVLLEPLGIDETARILGISRYSRECGLVQRATGGLPQAVHALAPLLRGRELRPGGRDVLRPSDPTRDEADQWLARVQELRLARHLLDVGAEEFVTAAPFATAPWLVPAEATSLLSRPQAGRILTELRTALWVTAPSHGGGTMDYAELHPWIARTLLSALAARQASPDEPSYETQFEALLNDPDTQGDPVRKAYCELALGRISDVVSWFEASFDQGPHQDWIEQLALVTGTPDNKALDRDCTDLYEELVKEDSRDGATERSPIRNILTRLVAASRLVTNPFATPDPYLKNIIVKAYGELAPLSRRPDVAALYEAAERTRELF